MKKACCRKASKRDQRLRSLRHADVDLKALHGVCRARPQLTENIGYRLRNYKPNIDLIDEISIENRY